jgi:hypothetical protein
MAKSRQFRIYRHPDQNPEKPVRHIREMCQARAALPCPALPCSALPSPEWAKQRLSAPSGEVCLLRAAAIEEWVEITFVFALLYEMRQLEKKKKIFQTNLINAAMDEPDCRFRWMIRISGKWLLKVKNR